MLGQLVHLLKGQVTGRVESGFPERVLNICAEHAIAFWDLRWESEVAFTFTMTFPAGTVTVEPSGYQSPPFIFNAENSVLA